MKSWVVPAVVSLAVVIAPLGFLAGIWLLERLPGSESGPIADVVWRPGGKPWTVTFEVLTTDDRPLQGVHVNADNDSGGSSGVTGPDGKALIEVGEPELTGIDLDAHRVMDRSGDFSVAPSVQRGLHVTIRVKDVQALQRR